MTKMKNKFKISKSYKKEITEEELCEFSEKDYNIKKVVKVESIEGISGQMIIAEKDDWMLYVSLTIPFLSTIIVIIGLLSRKKEVHYIVEKKKKGDVK